MRVISLIFIVKVISFVFFFIPDFAVMGLARLLSPIFYRAMKKGKWGFRIKRILPKVFKGKGPDWYDSIMRLNAIHLMKFAGEMLKAHYKLDFFLRKKVYIAEGKEYLDDLLKSKEGFIILTCHLGNWEYAAAWLAMMYKPLYAPVFVEDSEGNRALNWIREGHRINMLSASYDPRVSAKTLVKMIRAVENGEILYIVGDQEALSNGYTGELFGKQVKLFGGPFIIGKKTGKMVIPMYSIRNKRNRIELHFEKPFFLNSERIEDDIKKVTDFFERNISKYPDQYLWSQDRW